MQFKREHDPAQTRRDIERYRKYRREREALGRDRRLGVDEVIIGVIVWALVLAVLGYVIWAWLA